MKMAECRMHGKQKSHRLFLHSPKMIRGLLRLRAVSQYEADKLWL